MSDQVIPVSAPINNDSAGNGGVQAINSVFRIVCPDTNSSGTGFLHHSGNVITAEHVSRGSANVNLVFANGSATRCSIVAADQELDLAVLAPIIPVHANALSISGATGFSIGAQVTTWGFPGGYPGPHPMLSVGYLSSMIGLRKPSGRIVNQWCVNAAFNSGNSGGPLLDVESGEVIGVVSSKLAPMSEQMRSALAALEGQTSGFMYSGTLPDGTTIQVSEGQVVAGVLNELRGQVQLVIGMAVSLDDLRNYLLSNGITP